MIKKIKKKEKKFNISISFDKNDFDMLSNISKLRGLSQSQFSKMTIVTSINQTNQENLKQE